ncbi:hypothetical protein C7H19_08120 [Aphanothece hegewaldii CCALA 016]|uniref:Uncharacterized protein n=1 Tax=Aphanothece hegewaldii CCALA 016 TaxID=2107694 RepID=A0A2T1LZV1_9CHRO|nr:hypothetical protein [Aphanothece hegewaldii]PSF37932.1 hypothetical protein C7H19_08120 [Aphanothece hegewaldii CCALA 016]
MLDATLNITQENTLLSAIFPVNIENNIEQFHSSLLADSVSLHLQPIQAKPLTLDTPIVLTIFADWLAHLRTNQALTDDFDQRDQHDSLLNKKFFQNRYSKNTEDSLLSEYIDYEYTSFSIDDNLLCYSDSLN